MDRKEIIAKLILGAQDLYSLPAYKSNPAFQREVAAAEEELLHSLFSLSQTQELKHDEHALSLVLADIERIDAGKPMKSREANLRSRAIQGYLSIQTMMEQNQESKSQKEVPEALLAYVERSLDFDEKASMSAQAPGFAVSMLKHGLSVVKSSLQGFALEPVLASSTRFDSSPRNDRRVLSYQSKIGRIRIELIDEGNSRLGVRFSFPSSLDGQAILKYIEGSDLNHTRILDSYTLSGNKEISFGGLEHGSYVVEIPSQSCRIPFLVQ